MHCAARARALGCWRREKASLRWSQWMLFITVMIGGAILLSVIIPVGLKFSLLLGQDIDLRSDHQRRPDELVAWRRWLCQIGESLIGISLFLVALLALISSAGLHHSRARMCCAASRVCA